MADSLVGSVDLGFVAKNRVPGNVVSGLSAPANYVSIGAMRSRLTAIDAGYYTAERLNSLTVNDMVYALRLADDPGTI